MEVLYEQFIRERQYLLNVSAETVELIVGLGRRSNRR